MLACTRLKRACKHLKGKFNTTYPVSKRTFKLIIFQTILTSIFHSQRLAGHASYENDDKPLSAVCNENKASESAVNADGKQMTVQFVFRNKHL